MKNIEVKARVRDITVMRKRVEELAGPPFISGDLVDTHFAAQRGNLMLRVINGRENQLIHYQRSDESAEPRLSDWQMVNLVNSVECRSILTAALGLRGTIKKKRSIYAIKDIVIRLDEVQGMGAFVEIVGPVTGSMSEKNAKAFIGELMIKLGIESIDLIRLSYKDHWKEFWGRVLNVKIREGN